MADQTVVNTTGAAGDAASRIFGAATNNYFSKPIDDTTLSQSQYKFNSLVFPSDLGNENNGHYMVININVPVTKAGNTQRGAPIGTLLPGDYSKVDVLKFGKQGAAGFPAGSQQAEALSIPRYTRRIAESIGLFMPNGLVYDTENAYEEISLTAMAGGVGAGTVAAAGLFAAGVAGAIPTGGASLGAAGITAIGAQYIAGAIGKFGNVIGNVAKVAGHPINPRVEIVFSTTKQRVFTFEMLFAPTNEKESQDLQKIIQTLRLYAAPEIDPATWGFTFIPPAEFDITFYDKGRENTTIPRINTCVLQWINVDYAPTEGVYSTFRNGHPVAVSLSMRFIELEIIHKLRVAQGF